MRKILFAIAAMACLTGVASAEPKTYALDKSHATVAFELSHLGFSTAHGVFRSFDANLILDEARPAASKVDVTIDAASIDTFFARRDEHLKSPDFFNVAQFPTIRFVSTSVVRPTPDAKTARVTGDLTLHGVTKPVTLDVKLNQIGENPINKRPTVGFSASGVIKRSDFGITAYVPAVGDEVRLTIDAEFNQPAPPAPTQTPAAPPPAARKKK